MNENNKKTKLSFNGVFGDIREKLDKITYYKFKENPAIKQAEIMIQGEMKMGEKIIKEAKPKKIPDLHPELKKFIKEQNERWNNQFELNNEIKEFIKDQNRRWNNQFELNNEIKEFIKDQNRRWDEQFKFNHQQNQKWKDQTELNQEIKEFIKDQNRRWDEQNQKWDQQIKTNQVVLTSIQEILLRLERIESLPTIKKELSNTNQ